MNDKKALHTALWALALCSFFVYSNTLFNGFVYDDDVQVLENFWIRDFRYIPRIFSEGAWQYYSASTNYYRPLMHVIFMLDYHVFGLHAWGFHLVNILFNIGVSVLVFLITLRLLRETAPDGQAGYIRPAFIASLIFLCNPVHVEAVAWVAGIPDLSFTFFYLLSFHYYMRSKTRSQSGYDGFYLKSLIYFYLAILCKEPAITLPVLLAAYDYTAGKKAFRLKNYAPYLVVASVYIIQRTVILGGFAPHTTSIRLNNYQYLLSSITLFADYIAKLLFPFDLNAFHVFHAAGSALEPRVLSSLIILVVFTTALVILFRKRSLAFIGMLFFAVPLLPALYIPAVGKNVFAERYLYLPSFGLVLIIAHLLARTGTAKIKAYASAAIIALSVIFFMGTVERNSVWRNDETLWKDTIQKSPDSPTAFNWLGNAYMSQGRLDKAEEQFKTAIRLQGNYAMAHTNLGNVYNNKGEIAKAIEEYNISLKLKPDDAYTHNNLGVALGKSGALDKSVAEFNTALRLRPNYASAYNNMGIAYKRMGDRYKALEQFKKAIDLDPDDGSYRRNLQNLINTRINS